MAVLVKLLIATFPPPHKSQWRRDADDPPEFEPERRSAAGGSVGHRTRLQPSEAQRLTPESQWRSAPCKIAAIGRLDVGVIWKMQKTV
jgi:hypothetical protein